MKVIGAGFGRTGTLSLKAALERLGFGPCYHMTEVFSHPEHIPLWRAATVGNGDIAWRELFKDYQATVDWPGCSFYRQLMAEYPDAKVLLSVRASEAWYESCRSTIYKLSHAFPASLMLKLLPFLPVAGPGKVANTLVWQQTFQGRFEDKRLAIETFEAHIQEVKQLVPPERLLVFDVKDGWEPLCRFLNVPVPEEPFPRLNDKASFQANIKRAQLGSAAALGAGVLGVALLLRWLRSR